MTIVGRALLAIALTLTFFIGVHLMLVFVTPGSAVDFVTQWNAAGDLRLGRDLIYIGVVTLVVIAAVWHFRNGRSALRFAVTSIAALSLSAGVLMWSARPRMHRWMLSEWYLRNVLSAWLLIVIVLMGCGWVMSRSRFRS